MNATRGEHLVQELLWVHGILRSDLETVSHLLAHLDYEEESISPTLRAWDRWPFF